MASTVKEPQRPLSYSERGAALGLLRSTLGGPSMARSKVMSQGCWVGR